MATDTNMHCKFAYSSICLEPARTRITCTVVTPPLSSPSHSQHEDVAVSCACMHALYCAIDTNSQSNLIVHASVHHIWPPRKCAQLRTQRLSQGFVAPPLLIDTTCMERSRELVRSRSPALQPPDGEERSRDELVRAGWTKRKATTVLKRYQKWGYDDDSKRIQRESKNGWLSWREALLMAEVSEDTPPPIYQEIQFTFTHSCGLQRY